MSDNLKIGIIVSAVSLLLIAIAIIIFIRTIIFLSSSKKTKGTIVNLAYHNGKDGSIYNPVFQFTTNDGRTIAVEDKLGSNPPQFRVGQIVDILYDPQEPSRARINKWINLYLAPLLLSGMGFCLLCVASIFLMLK